MRLPRHNRTPAAVAAASDNQPNQSAALPPAGGICAQD
jgi:hypothetical protein